MAEDENQNQRVLSRIGYAAHGAYYLLLSLLVGLLVRPGGGGSDASAQGALTAIAQQPFGRLALIAVALGFAVYAWVRARAAVDADELGERLSQAGRSIVWAAFTALTIRTVFSGGGSGSSESSITARVLGWPGGSWLVGAVGLVVVAVGLRHLARAWSGALADELEVLDLAERRFARALGAVGHGGRALAFTLVGGFVVRAAATHDPSSSQGLDGALQDLLGRPFGPWVVGAVAVGFAAFGSFRLVESRYRFPEDER